MEHDYQAMLLKAIAGVATELHDRSPGSVQAGLDDRLCKINGVRLTAVPAKYNKKA